jgi:hypothetical protein
MDRRQFGVGALAAGLAMSGLLLEPRPANAVDVGQPAPDFRGPRSRECAGATRTACCRSARWR